MILASPPPMDTAEQVRAAYVSAGYVVDQPTWWSDGVVALAIHDPAGEQPGWPAVRAFVYAALPDQPAGPQLLSGYSVPTWEGSVAIMRADPTAFVPEPDCRPVEVRLS